MYPNSETLRLPFAERAKGAIDRKNGSSGKITKATHGRINQDGLELGPRTNLRTVPKTKIDVPSTAAAFQQNMRIAETHELKHERSNLS
jgi:hypothetical protein